jgi:hypothetical protein
MNLSTSTHNLGTSPEEVGLEASQQNFIIVNYTNELCEVFQISKNGQYAGSICPTIFSYAKQRLSGQGKQ